MPYPVKLCLNGHEWAKQQLRREGIAFESLDNGFFSCEDPARLQKLYDQLGPDHIQAFFQRWSRRLPWRLRKKRGGFLTEPSGHLRASDSWLSNASVRCMGPS